MPELKEKKKRPTALRPILPTPNQARLIELVMANYGAKKARSLHDLMIDAGYSEAAAKNPKGFLNSTAVQNGLSEFIDNLDDRRKAALRALTDKKLEVANPASLVYVLDVLTKNHQLLSGGKTGNEAIEITWQK